MANAVTPGKLMEELETLVSSSSNEEFIYGFLSAYGLPKGTITQLRNGGSRNIAMEPGAVGLKQKIYFLPLEPGESASNRLESLEQSPAINRNKIRFAVTTDFESFLARDLKTGDLLDIDFFEIPRNFSFFLPLAGMEKVKVHNEAEADVKAAERMGRLCDLIRDKNPVETEEQRHALNVFLTRLLFCYYAEDTGIFGENQFTEAVKANTADDGSDTHEFLASLFDALDRAQNDRGNLPSHLAEFPYVNGGLFETAYPVPIISRKARRMLLDAGALDWRSTNPDIFGSMFQAVIDPEQRGELGQHYTSVTNILKVIRPLFLDGLEQDVEKAVGNEKLLKKLLARLGTIKVFDPACGSGNFLIIAYKELRRLEIKVFKALDALSQPQEFAPSNQNRMFSDLEPQQPLRVGGQQEMWMSGISLDQFYGIELDDFAHEIAKLALWIAEHQMKEEFQEEFGYSEPALPLRDGGCITCTNSLTADWKKICPQEAGSEVYICGNPPFLGWKNRSEQQNADMKSVFEGFSTWKSLDFVACWFYKASIYIKGSASRAGFVSTNSLFQGEQTAVLWPRILETGLVIQFAYQTFIWKNAAKGNAGVHVVIVGLSDPDHSTAAPRSLFSELKGVIHRREVKNISPYLVEGSNIVVKSRSRPIQNVSRLMDGNNYSKSLGLFLSTEERDQLLDEVPQSSQWIRKIVGAEEFMKGTDRWCLWFVGADVNELYSYEPIASRLRHVRDERLKSDKKLTREKDSQTPHLFPEIRQPTDGSYLLVPRVTSERRRYTPLGYLDHSVITTNQVMMIPNATSYDFGILSSTMHMDWMRLVGGRLKSDYRYSGGLIYNTFPWPTCTERQKEEIAILANAILRVRENHFHLTMAELYDPDKMPEELLNAHIELDRAVDRAYRTQPFATSSDRHQFLLNEYQKLINAENSNAT